MVSSKQLTNVDHFMNIMKGLSDKLRFGAAKTILRMYEEKQGAFQNFYDQPDLLKRTMEEIFGKLSTTDPYLEALVKIEAATPYSIFSYILNENYSDILIHVNGIDMSDSGRTQRYSIPDELSEIYRMFVDHFCRNIVYKAGKKFDMADSIVDADLDIYRFNLIHSSLETNDFHCIAIRKQTIVKGFNMDQKAYLGSVGLDEEQQEIINSMALKGNTIVFGEVGSGKTTLVKYMGNHDLDKKRNLVTIEDTSELHIPVPIALITNRHKNIKDLFVASLRQNPSHVIIGETRTDEIVDILESALTINVITTIHANSFERAIQRILFMSAERNIDLDDLKDLIKAAVDCFVFMENRKVKEIWVRKENSMELNVLQAYKKVK